MEQDLEARHGGTIRYLSPTANGASEELPATSVQQTGTAIIMNPFLTRLWPQHPENMTLLPALLASSRPRTDSWRRMHLTSPPVTSLSMSLWYVTANPYNPPVSPHNKLTNSRFHQVHQKQRARQSAPSVHRPRAQRRDLRASCRYARRAAKEAGVPLDDAARGSFVGALNGRGSAAEERRCRRGALEGISRRVRQSQQWNCFPGRVWKRLEGAAVLRSFEAQGWEEALRLCS